MMFLVRVTGGGAHFSFLLPPPPTNFYNLYRFACFSFYGHLLYRSCTGCTSSLAIPVTQDHAGTCFSSLYFFNLIFISTFRSVHSFAVLCCLAE